MDLAVILLTGLALSMDAFTVSVSKGMTLKNLTTSLGIKIALSFGIFQGIMPFLGWFLGVSFEKYIVAIDHWIALILLTYLGFNMIKGFFEKDEVEENKSYLTNKELFVLSIATSIDALAVGISFAFTDVNIYYICISITVITFIMCLIGVFLGKKIGNVLSFYAELLGGVILILIGLNIFNEHTHFISNIF